MSPSRRRRSPIRSLPAVAAEAMRCSSRDATIPLSVQRDRRGRNGGEGARQNATVSRRSAPARRGHLRQFKTRRKGKRDMRLQLGSERRPDPLHPLQTVERTERSVALPILHDPRRQRRADPRQRLQSRRIRDVDVHWTGRECAGSGSAVLGGPWRRRSLRGPRVGRRRRAPLPLPLRRGRGRCRGDTIRAAGRVRRSTCCTPHSDR